MFDFHSLRFFPSELLKNLNDALLAHIVGVLGTENPPDRSLLGDSGGGSDRTGDAGGGGAIGKALLESKTCQASQEQRSTQLTWRL